MLHMLLSRDPTVLLSNRHSPLGSLSLVQVLTSVGGDAAMLADGTACSGRSCYELG